MRVIPFFMLCAALALISAAAPAEDFQTRVVMIEKAAATFYVPAQIAGFGPAELMVDTGSGYVTINEDTLAVLRRNGKARYVKQLRGVLADGSELTVPVYAISAIAIGGDCWLHDVEAAVFPGKSRQILGLSALRKTAPFVFSVEPPELLLSRCTPPPVAVNDLSTAPGGVLE
jgi:predicted aspartyl protease